MGTAAGDAVLRRMAERFARAASDIGTIARITADRFALALRVPDSNGDGVHAIVERLQQIFETPVQIESEAVRIQAKTGIAVFPEDGDSPDALFANAEAALKKAKVSGDRLVFYARDMNARVAELMRLENKLRIALREEQYVLYYQPRVSLATGKMCGMEALLRWRSPDLGIVPPCEFIPLLEETGLILDVGRWVLQRASADAERWRRLGLEVPSIGVNVSAIQLREPGFFENVTAALAAGGSNPSSIELELTETMVMADVETNARKLEQIRAAGIRIEIDDFGTGYSSLSYLARLPVDTLKIDRSFITPMSASPVHMAIVTTVISLARSLNLRVVAEGVETEQQANLLRLLRCDEAQGFLYSKPVPPDEVPGLIRRFAAGRTAPAPGGASFAAMAVLPVEAQHVSGAVALRSKLR
jgi:EAL domain-containing protein (putative c-di-GMP-specific phosphodiesterase class I)/GGDEF domain-containing protein